MEAIGRTRWAIAIRDSASFRPGASSSWGAERSRPTVASVNRAAKAPSVRRRVIVSFPPSAGDMEKPPV